MVAQVMVSKFYPMMVLFLIAGLSGAMSGCNKDDKPDKPKPDSLEQSQLRETSVRGATHRVLNSAGLPVFQAKILVGSGLVGESSNFLTSNEQGEFTLPPEAGEFPDLTIEAPGYLRTSFFKVQSSSRSFFLKKSLPFPIYEVRGITGGHPIVTGDKEMDFSLVMGAMKKEDLLNLSVDRILSPETDRVTAVGQTVNIPTNVSLPRQSERYSIVNVTLDKPVYRVKFDETGSQKIYALRGRFPFKPVVDALRQNTEFFELLNYFQITGGTVQLVDVQGTSTGSDINVMQANYSQKISIQAPPLPGSQLVIGVSIADMGSYLLPTDFKRLESGQRMALSILPSKPALMTQILKNKNEVMGPSVDTDRLSAVFGNLTENVQVQFLGLVSNPRKISDYEFELTQPSLPQGFEPQSLYAAVVDLEKLPTGSVRTRKVWEIYMPEWTDRLKLPSWVLERTGNGRKLEVSFIAGSAPGSQDFGPGFLDQVSHLSKSSVEL